MELSQLIRECKRSGITAQKYLYDRFAVSMFLICRRYLKSDSDAEEAVQNGFLKIFNHIQQFSYSTDQAFVAWMKKIMVNECLQEMRKKGSCLSISLEVASDVVSEEDTIGRISESEMYRLITELPTGYRTIFNLFAIDGYSHREIAHILNINEGTSKSQLNKARKILQQLILQKNTYYAEAKST